MFIAAGKNHYETRRAIFLLGEGQTDIYKLNLNTGLISKMEDKPETAHLPEKIYARVLLSKAEFKMGATSISQRPTFSTPLSSDAASHKTPDKPNSF